MASVTKIFTLDRPRSDQVGGGPAEPKIVDLIALTGCQGFRCNLSKLSVRTSLPVPHKLVALAIINGQPYYEKPYWSGSHALAETESKVLAENKSTDNGGTFCAEISVAHVVLEPSDSAPAARDVYISVIFDMPVAALPQQWWGLMQIHYNLGTASAAATFAPATAPTKKVAPKPKAKRAPVLKQIPKAVKQRAAVKRSLPNVL